jgi:hypothetical protein
MKKTVFIIFSMAFAMIISIQSSAQKADFNGSWKLDMTKSTLPEYTPVLLQIDVQIKGDSLLTERHYDTGDGQVYPFTENLTLDGKEYNITIYEMPRKSKASWAEPNGSVVVESTTTTNGSGDFLSKEEWKANVADKTLIISFKNNIEGQESTGLFLLNKVE